MRLICPNCGAQYEVDDAVVPDNGRDVQCSNCGHTWFQRPANKDKELAEELGTDEADIEDATPQVEADADGADQDDDTFVEDDADDQYDEPDEAPEHEPQRRELDAGVADILRQEAELESQHRLAEGSSLETQDELGLSGEADDHSSVKERMARLRGLSDDNLGATAAAAVATRKDLLPDIEEINSTLTASSDRDDEETADEYQEKRQRRGFRRGFSLTLLLFAVMAVVYAYAPKIVEMYPASEPALSVFVSWVNTLRENIDRGMMVAVEKLTSLLAQLTGSGEGS